MNIESFPLEGTDLPCKLSELAENTESQWLAPEDLDKPFFLTQENRHELAPVSAETKEKMEEAGFPDSVIEAIGSDAEANIYLEAELEPQQVNGKDALVRTDIDLDQKDLFGDTNLERMEQGRAPLDAQGNPIELHHVGQKPDSPLAELTRAEHREGGNDNGLHNKLKESEIDRSDFGKERQEYWKARAGQIHNQA